MLMDLNLINLKLVFPVRFINLIQRFETESLHSQSSVFTFNNHYRILCIIDYANHNKATAG